MESNLLKRERQRKRRVRSIRRKVVGSEQRPRLALFRSNAQLFAQAIDDGRSHTVVGLGTMDALFKESGMSKSNAKSAQALGKEVGVRLKKAGVEAVVFDRRHYRYHGVLAHFLDAVRAEGIVV